MKKFYFFCLLFLPTCNVFCQQVHQPVSAQYLGSGAYSQNHMDVFSMTNNQAALAEIKNTTAGVYGERRFLLNETSLYTAVIALPTKQGNFGLQADYFGFKNYNESQIGFAYARSLGSKLDIGIKFNYYALRIPVYGNASTINFEVGGIIHLSEKLHAGVHFYNPVAVKFGKTREEKLSSEYKFGMGYEASDKFLISGEIIKQEDVPVNVNVGFTYNFEKRFFAKAGINSSTSVWYAGGGFSWDNYRLDVSASYHQQLGISPGLMLIMNFKSKRE